MRPRLTSPTSRLKTLRAVRLANETENAPSAPKAVYALANELVLDRENAGTITIPFGTWDYGTKKVKVEGQVQGGGGQWKDIFFRQTLDRDGAMAIAEQVRNIVANGDKGVPVYWGHPDVPELAHKYPDKRAKGWIKGAEVRNEELGIRNDGSSAIPNSSFNIPHSSLVLSIEWLEENATDGFGWFSPYWTGPAKINDDGTAMMHVDALASVALINMPNISEFRLANELQDNDNNAAKAEKGKTMNIEELKQLLGLPPEATEDQIKMAIAELAKAKEAAATEKTKAEAAEAEKTEAVNECKEAKEALANERAAHVGILLDNAIADGRISVAGRAAWEKRLAEDFAAGKVALANEKPLKRESAVQELAPGKTTKPDLVALANERMAKHPGMTYVAAFAQVMKENPEVK